MPDVLLIRSAARAIRDGMAEWERRFRTITRGARGRFEARDWPGAQAAAEQRLGIFDDAVRKTLTSLEASLGGRIADLSLWREIRPEYSSEIAQRQNRELAETFYNSITRKLFAERPVDVTFEFVEPTRRMTGSRQDPETYRRFPLDRPLDDIIARLLETYRFQVPWADFGSDVENVTQEIRGFVASLVGTYRLEAIEMLRAVFFRSKGAFLVGRLVTGREPIPLVLCLRHGADGVTVDAALMSEDDVSILFSFARSYFQVDVRSPRRIIRFLKSILPLKPVAELYTSLGFNKHGKTELYRRLAGHLESAGDRFELAPGDRGMVMLVFTLLRFDTVFKVIRDEFDYPKQTTRREVQKRYKLVFRHDRGGRLVDAQAFEQLRFPRLLFAPDLLEELIADASRTVTVSDDEVVFRHLYSERKVTPLNLYLRSAPPARAQAAVIDYGRAIKELAAANIFPGDFLLKNFGVTRHGRVVFYDYDELCLLDDCKFRRLPPPAYPEAEFAAQPWFSVGADDIFPEEFVSFLGMPDDLRELFVEHHSDLFDVEFWRRMQDRLRRGELPDLFPYPLERRLDRRRGQSGMR